MSACEVLSSVLEFVCGKLISIFLDFLCQTAKKFALRAITIMSVGAGLFIFFVLRYLKTSLNQLVIHVFRSGRLACNASVLVVAGFRSCVHSTGVKRK